MSGIVKGIKKVFKAVKSFILPVVATIALGPAGLGLSLPAAGAIGGAAGGLAQGGGLKGALMGAALGGLGGWAGSGFQTPSLWASGAGGAASGAAGSAGGSLFDTTFNAGLNTLGPGLSSAPASLGFGGAGVAGGALGGGAGSFGGSLGYQSGQGFSLGQLGQDLLDQYNPTTRQGFGNLAKGGLDIAKNLYQSQQQNKLAQQMAQMADPYKAQRGQAVNQGLSALTDPTANPLYQQSLAEAERALARRQAASGGYYSGRSLEEAAQLPANVAAALQAQQVQGSGQVAAATGGSPASAAQLYGAGRGASIANKADLFNVTNKQLQSIYGA